MDTKRWQRLRQLFDSAIELEPGRRSSYLEEACGDDSDLRQEVLSLLDKEPVSSDSVVDAVGRAAATAVAPEVASLEQGDHLGRYTILQKLGAGGMGEVYVAEDRELRRKVALKVLTGWITSDAEQLRRFQREARLLAALDHSSIVTIYSVEHEDDLHFLTMELVEGTNLDEIVPEEGLKIGRFFDIALPLAKALAAAHEQGVVHRDLKPSNVMLGDDGKVKMLDFGLAKLGQGEATSEETGYPTASLTQTGVVMGTVPYMSPEQVEGKTVDHRSDIFSLGIIFYEMATGSRPFSGDSSAALMSSILKEKPPSISSLRRELPPRLEQIVERCLEKDPEHRYQAAALLVEDLAALQEAVEHHPTLARGLGKLSALLPKARASRLTLTAAALMALVAIIPGLDFEAFERRLAGRSSVPQIASLAVLPLVNLSGSEDQEYLADGTTEALITELSKIGEIKVISRTSVMRFKGSSKPLDEIASKLGVDVIVEGSVRRSEDRIGVTAKLIHAATGEPLWAESFERGLRDLLALQSEVARAIAQQINVTLTPEEQARLSSADRVAPRATEAYFRGLHHWNRFSFREAAEAFQAAIELDPGFARAYAGLARARQMQGISFGHHPPKKAFALAKAAAARALELDNDLAEAHAVQGWTALHFDWDWETTEREFSRALELNPGHANAHSGLSFYLAVMRRFDEALAAAERARELDPLSPMATVMLCSVHYYARDYERATFELGERWDSDFFPHYWMSSRLASAKGDADGAAWSAFRGGQILRIPQPLLDDLEEALTTEGPAGYWRETLKLHLSDPAEVIPAKLVAEAHARLGETDKALDWLDRAYERRDSLADLGIDPIWDPLRDDPRFNDLLLRLKLP
jgi:serine/threonine-protein kinase